MLTIKRYVLLFITTLGLIIITGCSNVKPQTEFGNQIYIHPELASPVTPVTVNWQTFEVNGVNYVGLPLKQFIPFRIQQQETLRYIQKSNNALCYYRQGLYEPRCEAYNRSSSNEESKNEQNANR